MTIDGILRDSEAKAETRCFKAFGASKGLKHMPQHVSRDAWTGVGNFNFKTIAAQGSSNVDRQILG